MTAPPDDDADLSALLAGATASLKIFPLPQLVVFPGAPAPFHIFEPRYRCLVADALDAERMLAVATIMPGHEAEANPSLAASPPLLPIAGAGFIEGDEKLADGRYHIVFRGLARVRLLDEIQRGMPYREFRTEIVDDLYPPAGPEALRGPAETLVQLVLDLSDRELRRDVVLDARKLGVDLDRGEVLPRFTVGDLRRMAFLAGVDLSLIGRYLPISDDFFAPIDTAGVAVVSRVLADYHVRRSHQLMLRVPEAAYDEKSRHHVWLMQRAETDADAGKRWRAFTRSLTVESV